MTAAAPAVHFRSGHQQSTVFRRTHGTVERLPKTGPPGMAFKLRRGGKQRQLATGAMIGPRAQFPIERTGPWPLGPMLTQHAILCRSQHPSPLLVRPHDLEVTRFRRRSRPQPPRCQTRSAQRNSAQDKFASCDHWLLSTKTWHLSNGAVGASGSRSRVSTARPTRSQFRTQLRTNKRVKFNFAASSGSRVPNARHRHCHGVL